MLDLSRRRLAEVVQILFKCFVFAGLALSAWKVGDRGFVTHSGI